MNHHIRIKQDKVDLYSWDDNDEPLRKQKHKSTLESSNTFVNSWCYQVPPYNES